MTGVTNERNWQAVKEFVEKSMKHVGMPGVGVGILHHDQVTAGGFGVTSADNPLPVTDDTIFQIGSISKTFAGTAIMQLVEQGKVQLDAPVRTYIPEFRVADEETSANSTLRHLLIHVGGWDGDVLPYVGMGDDAFAKCTASLADREQITPLGTVYGYNNAGYAVVGDIIERVAGNLFERIIQGSVFDPLGMKHSFMEARGTMPHRFAIGHWLSPEGPQVAPFWGTQRAGYPVGGIASSVRDMLKYAQFHLGDGQTAEGKRLLSRESMAQLHSPQVVVYDKEGWGISFEVNDSFGARQFGHSGRAAGHISSLTMVPEHDFAVVVLTNGDPGGLSVCKDVTRFAVQQFLGIEMRDPELIPATPQDYKEYVGKYSRPTCFIETGMLGGRFIAQYVPTQGFTKDSPVPPPLPPVGMGLVGKDRVRGIDSPTTGTMEFVRKPDGTVGWLRWGRIYTKV